MRRVERATTLRDLLLGVLVDGRRLWLTARLRRGDRVVVFPIVSGG
ncbi:MAG TPA: MoaD/ThiS family protein [Candidatus Bathyarchaeota archaeon]|nr:MoaD/ThiS family protein [Candidatus Bathyarchaeota archaeon]